MSNKRETSPRLAYVVAICEDACLGDGGKPGFFLDIESSSKSWLESSVASRLSEILREKVTVKKRTTRTYYRIRLWDKKLVSLLTDIRRNVASVLLWSERAKLAWVSGFIDAEGSVTLTGENQPMLSIYNTNLRRLEVIEEILKPYGIIARYYKPHDRGVWQQYFTGRSNLIKLSKTVRIEHPEKTAKLRSYLLDLGRVQKSRTGTSL